MFESVLNQPISSVVINPGSGPLTDAAVFLNGGVSAQVVTFSQIGSSPVWAVSFTPTTTGVWSLVAFGSVQLRTTVVVKSLYDFLKNVEDEAIGSWSWDKTGGVLTLLRQDGTLMTTYDVVDGLETASRELVS